MLSGAAKAAEQMTDYADELPALLRERAEAHAQSIARRARELAPVATGRLRDSIRVAETQEGFAVGTDAPYAARIELGGFETPPRPFLSTAAREERTT